MYPLTNPVVSVEPMLAVPAFYQRFRENLDAGGTLFIARGFPQRSDEFFADDTGYQKYAGCLIDGDHDRPHPLNDAQNCAKYLAESGCILFHDFSGAPVQEAVLWLMDHGFKCRVYWTPHMMACCFRGSFEPPDHIRDERLPWRSIKHMMYPFPFERCV